VILFVLNYFVRISLRIVFVNVYKLVRPNHLNLGILYDYVSIMCLSQQTRCMLTCMKDKKKKKKNATCKTRPINYFLYLIILIFYLLKTMPPVGQRLSSTTT
jgi:hypothetical protein